MISVGPPPTPMLAPLAASYHRAHAARPLLLSQSLGFCIATGGDLACQLAVEKRPAPDLLRTLHMGLVRAFLMAPILYHYFPALARALPGSSWPRVAGRVALDSALASPAVTVATFAAFSALQGRPGDALPRIQAQLLPTWATGLCYWPFIHLANFRFVAAPHQALVAHCASVPWSMVLSYRANLGLEGGGGAAPAAAAEAA